MNASIGRIVHVQMSAPEPCRPAITVNIHDDDTLDLTVFGWPGAIQAVRQCMHKPLQTDDTATSWHTWEECSDYS